MPPPLRGATSLQGALGAGAAQSASAEPWTVGGPVGWASLEKHCCHVCLERMRDFPGCWELESDLDLGAISCEPQAGALPAGLLDAPAPVPLQSALHSSSSTLCPGLVLQIIPQSQAGLRPALPCSLPCSPPLPPGRPPGWCGRKEERPSVRPFLHFSSQKQVFSVEMPTASRLHRPFPARLYLQPTVPQAQSTRREAAWRLLGNSPRKGQW